MKINANEIDSIEDAGELGAQPVKMIRTKGGLWIAVGTPKGKLREEALAAGSHPAIVKYNIEKKYPDFMPALQKSESLEIPVKVMQHSHFLTEDLRKSGYDIHSLDNGVSVNFVVTRHGVDVGSVSGDIQNNCLVLNSIKAFPNAQTQPVVRPMMAAIAEKALTEKYDLINTKGIRNEG